jgi:hypothetical protein
MGILALLEGKPHGPMDDGPLGEGPSSRSALRRFCRLCGIKKADREEACDLLEEAIVDLLEGTMDEDEDGESESDDWEDDY